MNGWFWVPPMPPCEPHSSSRRAISSTSVQYVESSMMSWQCGNVSCASHEARRSGRTAPAGHSPPLRLRGSLAPPGGALTAPRRPERDEGRSRCREWARRPSTSFGYCSLSCSEAARPSMRGNEIRPRQPDAMTGVPGCALLALLLLPVAASRAPDSSRVDPIWTVPSSAFEAPGDAAGNRAERPARLRDLGCGGVEAAPALVDAAGGGHLVGPDQVRDEIGQPAVGVASLGNVAPCDWPWSESMTMW